MNPLNSIVNFLTALDQHGRHAVTDAIVVALLFPILMIISSFGHLDIGIPVWECSLLFTGIVLAIIYVNRERLLSSLTIFCVVALGAVIVSLMGSTDVNLMINGVPLATKLIGPMRYVSTITGLLFILAAWTVLGTLVYAGIVLGYGTYAVIAINVAVSAAFDQAKQTIRDVWMITFWVTAIGAYFGIAGGSADPQIMFGVLIVALVVIPGALALPGEQGFKIMFYGMIALLVYLIGWSLYSIFKNSLPTDIPQWGILAWALILFTAAAIGLIASSATGNKKIGRTIFCTTILACLFVFVARFFQEKWYEGVFKALHIPMERHGHLQDFYWLFVGVAVVGLVIHMIKTKRMVILPIFIILAVFFNWFTWDDGYIKTATFLSIPIKYPSQAQRNFWFIFVPACAITGILYSLKKGGWGKTIIVPILAGIWFFAITINSLTWGDQTLKSLVDYGRAISGYSQEHRKR